jgi:hypothetical protein
MSRRRDSSLEMKVSRITVAAGVSVLMLGSR